MTANEYTLLIVESPTIADYINQLRIPWLEVMATGGFCWHPVFNPQKLSLGKKADPEKRALRRELKEKSDWFNRIVIATDSDSSGDFIAWTIANFLPQKELFRAQLRLLTENSIMNRVSEAGKISQPNLKKKLEKRFVFRHLWNRHFRISIEDAALASLFTVINPFSTFSATGGALFRSDETVRTRYNHPLNRFNIDSGYNFHSPHSTWGLLEDLTSYPLFKSFEDSANKIFELFTATQDRELLHTISYPRTDASGYYKSTWNRIEAEWIKSRDLEKLLPPSARNILSDAVPHESIHPTNIFQTPDKMRGLLKPDLFFIYTQIYKRFMKSITWETSDCLVFEGECGIRLYPQNSSEVQDSLSITPRWTVESAGDRLCALGAVRPAAYGKKLDRWISRDLLKRNGIYLEPKGILKYDPELILSCHDTLIKAREIIEREEMGRDELKQLFPISR